MPIFQILVASYLPSRTDATALCQGMRAARDRAESRALTGGLLFDGEKFVQLFVGSQAAVQSALASMHTDPTQARLWELHSDSSEPEPGWRDWRVGYTEPAVLDALLAEAARGSALQAFARAMQAVDLA